MINILKEILIIVNNKYNKIYNIFIIYSILRRNLILVPIERFFSSIRHANRLYMVNRL